MSHGFHAHGAHDHEVEHQASRGVSLAQWVAILSAIFSCLAAFISYQGGAKQNEAIILKDEAIIKTTQASDAWSYLQAKKTKRHLMEVAMAATNDPKKTDYFKSEMARYQKDEVGIQANAEKLTREAAETDKAGDNLIRPHEKLAQSMMLLQIAISLASITALTRKTWLLGVSVLAAVIGMIFAILAWI